MFRENGCRRIKIRMLCALAVLFAVLSLPAHSMAAPKDSTAQQAGGSADEQKGGAAQDEREDVGKWKVSKQKVYYYKSGKKLKGLQKIGNKTYYFDRNGVQRTGWQKIKESYYFFKIANKEKGYMMRDKKVDGVTLKSSGKAKITKDSKSRLNVLIKANKIVEKATKPTMSKSKKLRKCFDYSIKKFKYRGSPKFRKTKNWDRDYALDMFDDKHGSCYAYGAAFAYLANAVGYDKVYAVSSGGHGWAEVDGKIYDPSWHLTDKKHSYYAVDPGLSGKGGRPNYKRARNYVKKL